MSALILFLAARRAGAGEVEGEAGIEDGAFASDEVEAGADVAAEVAASAHRQQDGEHLQDGGGGRADDRDGGRVVRHQDDAQNHTADAAEEDPQRAVALVDPRQQRLLRAGWGGRVGGGGLAGRRGGVHLERAVGLHAMTRIEAILLLKQLVQLERLSQEAGPSRRAVV
jgi:hypothetical protein